MARQAMKQVETVRRENDRKAARVIGAMGKSAAQTLNERGQATPLPQKDEPIRCADRIPPRH